MRCRVKVCGITSLKQAELAVELGVDAIGLVFSPQSPRFILPEVARDICLMLPPFVTPVGLFFNAEQDYVWNVLEQVPLAALQFHGKEPAPFCRHYRKPYIKAIGMQGIADHGGFAAYADRYGDAQGLLLDSHALGAAGGTGETFDWTQMPQNYPKPLILAGGLTPDNVAEAIRIARPYGVDVSSGVESTPGVKDADKLAAFMAAVREGEAR